MNYDVIYDVAMSEAPRSAFVFALGATAVTVLWSVWLRYRGATLHYGVKFFGFTAVLMFALGAASLWEQRVLAARRDVLIVDGPVQDHWTNRVRRSGKERGYWEQEGFRIQGVPFAYTRNLEQNYFHNGGGTSLDIVDGMPLRVHYLAERDGDEVRNQIIRVERARP